ncbi:phage scaffolding protein [Salibacterium lacus]|uniref:DUF4355 domain-containing protein n=1 Tax=Salibacterium lacus TaxID=1898109 RepID=A0ABW5SZM9_9BACI
MAEENEQTVQQTQETEGQTEEVNEQEQSAQETSETTEETSEETAEKTFTQSELDDIITKRLERERQKYSDYDEVRKKAEQYEKEAEERRLAEMSEKDRAEELARKHEEEKGEIRQELEDYKAKVQNERIYNDFIRQAQEQGIAYVDDAFQLADTSSVEVDEEGNINGTKDVIDALKSEKPFLLSQQDSGKPKKSVGSPTNNGGERATDKTSEQLVKEAEEKAKQTGKIQDRMNASKLRRELSN